MAEVLKSNFVLGSYVFVHIYPSTISPRNFPTSGYGKHNNFQRKSCCPCRSNVSINSRIKRNDLHNHDPWLYSVYGYGCGSVQGNRHLRYQVTRASKQAHNGDEEGYKQEEQRWLREEERWLREEQRWLREEARWNSERDSLLRQISHLTLKIHDLELELEGLRNRVDASYTVPETLSKIASTLQVLNNYTASIGTSSVNPTQNQISEHTEEISQPLISEHSNSETETQETVPPPAADTTPSSAPNPISEIKNKTDNEQKKQQRSSTMSLKMGSEGQEVQALQEALLSLGFYSGEEDMEFSSFSSGTQRAVKTWQASIGVPEDGIMTSELLEKLYAPQKADTPRSSMTADQNTAFTRQTEANGAPTAFVAEVQQTVVKKGLTDVDINQNRVYLLGENRWEEPSRLKKENGKQVNGDTTNVSATKCLACRGEGRLLCMECDGTGEPNVEPQFMEWVEEGLKCPYCEGLGYTVCDVCEGKAVA